MGRDRPVVPRRPRRRARRVGSRRGDRARRDRRGRPRRCSSRPRCASVGRNRVLVNKQAVTRRRDYARPPARHGVLARRPRGGEERPGPAARLPRRAARGERRRGSRRCAPTSSGCCASATRCCAAGSATPRRAPRSRCSTTASSRPAASWCAAGCELVERLTPGIAAGVRVARRRHARAWRCGTRPSGARARSTPAGSTTSTALLRGRAGDAAPPRDGSGRHAGRSRTATTGGSCSHGLDARSHASQGEQRTLALALRLAGHRLIASVDRQRPGAPARRRVQRARPGPVRRAGRAPARPPRPC